MKKAWPAGCAVALFVMAPTWPACALGQTSTTEVSRYQKFVVYPHQQAGYAALAAAKDAAKAGDKAKAAAEEAKAVAEFERARELAPKDVRTALDLAEAYRRSGSETRARRVMDEQRRYTPDDASVRAWEASTAAAPAVDCRTDMGAVCRSQRGFDALKQGDLAKVEAELAATDFARTTEGRALRHALVQRAIYLGDESRAEAQLGILDRDDKLSAEERGQWFQLLLKQGKWDEARQLQSRGGLDAPAQDLAFAQAIARGGDRQQLASYLASRQPAFEKEADERQWIYLMSQTGRAQPALLAGYAPRYPANVMFQARLLVPQSMARGDHVAAQRMLARVPADSFREERFTLALEQGRYADARQQAEALIAQPDGYRLLDSLSYRLMEAGSPADAKDLLMASYPFAGNPGSASMFARLAVLAGEQPALFASGDDRDRLRRPLESVPLRMAQVRVLGALHDCDGIRTVMSDFSSEYPADMWRQLGDCYSGDRPGLAEYAYAEANRRQPDSDVTRALAYQAYSAKDYATALQAWQQVPAAHMKPVDLMAAANTAITADEPAIARSWLETYVAQGGPKDHNYWWLLAQADEPRDPALARADLENAIALHPDPRYYQRLAALQTQDGEPQAALLSLQRASVLSPDDAALAASLGYAYLQAGEPEKARTQFESASRTNPDDPALTRQLLYVHQQLGDNEQAQAYAARAIDQLGPSTDGAAAGDGSQEDEDEQLYTLRRLHEDLGRKWRFNADMSLGDSVSSAANAAAPGVSYRSYLQLEGQYRFDPSLTGGDINTLAAYARVFAGSGASGGFWPVNAPMLGVGLHWKPLRSQNIVLTAEQQTPLSNNRDTHNDTMLRASGSWAFGTQYSDDWHAPGRSWITQNFYVDLAYYLRAEETVATLDYTLGWEHKLVEGQAIEPYVHLQYTGIDRAHGLGYEKDGRMGIGLQWNLWFGETRYDAYPHRLSLALEGQHAFTSYLRETNVVFLIVRTQW
ncbi:hypothetical protein CH75_07030 [Dyella jiangningensis]|nr:hypothetical protein CH75_07030 [Dyella jiangningensis]